MRIHQAAWLTWATGGAVVAITTTNPFYLGLLCAIAYLVHAAHWAPGPASRSFRIFVLFALGAVAIRTALVALTPLVPNAAPIGAGTFAAAVAEGLRLGTLLVVFGTFNSVADPASILKLAPRRFYEAGLAASLALSIAPRTIATVGRVRHAQRLRGITFSRMRALPALAVPVLEAGMEEALTLAESMDARGHGRGARTRYRPDRWNPASLLVVAVGLVAAVAFAVALTSHAPTLSMPSFPLQVPDAAPLLIAFEMTLAIPALLPRSTG